MKGYFKDEARKMIQAKLEEVLANWQ